MENEGISSSVAGDEQQNSIDEEDPLRHVSDEVYFRLLPPGYMFNPTDTELIVEYLAKKVKKQPLPRNNIYDVNLYDHNPEQLFQMFQDSGNNKKEGYLFFFTPRNRKYMNGQRPNRAAGNGYWKATGADKNILDSDGNIIGFRKTLVFYVGRPPKGVKTLWIMHEYRVNNSPECDRSVNVMRLDDWVLCKIYPKMDRTNMRSLNPSCKGNLEYNNNDEINNIEEDNAGNIEDVVIDDVPEETGSNTGEELDETAAAYYDPNHIYNQLVHPIFPPTNNNINIIIAADANINNHHQPLQLPPHHPNLPFGSPSHHQTSYYLDNHNNNLQGNPTLLFHHNNLYLNNYGQPTNTYQPQLAPANPGLQIHNYPHHLDNSQAPQPPMMSINANPYLHQTSQAPQPRSINLHRNDSTTQTQTDDDDQYDTNQFLA